MKKECAKNLLGWQLTGVGVLCFSNRWGNLSQLMKWREVHGAEGILLALDIVFGFFVLAKLFP